MLEKLSAREKNLLLVLLGVVMVAVFYFLVLKYQWPKFCEARQNLDLSKRQLQSTMDNLKKLPKLKALNEELTARMKKAEAPFIREITNGTNYYYIGKHALANSVTVAEVVPGTANESPIYLEIPLDIKVRGKYENILRFIALVEQDMPNTSELRTVVMKQAADAGGGTVPEPETPAVQAVTLKPVQFPEVEANLKIVTFEIKNSPQKMNLAQLPPLGRFDIFAPTVDVAKMAPEIPATSPLETGDEAEAAVPASSVPVPETVDSSPHPGTAFSEKPGTTGNEVKYRFPDKNRKM